MSFGYMGKILLVDLSSGKITEEILPDEVYEKHLSGTGLAAYLLYTMIPAGADPLGPDNVLGFVSGLLTGTGSLFTGRWMLVGKSPLTGTWGDANCGGFFSPAIKRCGYDGIFFKGISETPVYLYADGITAELRDASRLWGKDTVEAEQLLIAETSPSAHVALIGPAGEKLSLISGVSTDRGRMAARSGLGAVMGSKRIKAVVLEGKKRIPVFDHDAVHELSKRCSRSIPPSMPLPGIMNAFSGILLRVLPTAMMMDGRLVLSMYRKWGTTSLNQMSIEWGDAPIRNWTGSNRDFSLKRSARVNPDEIRKRERVKYHCYACPLGCGGICSLEGKYRETHKPEYETVLALGALCMNEDMESIFYLNEMLNRAGMDSISAGATAAFAIDCYEQGILTRADTGGLELTWGNTEAIVALLEKMAAREGIGNVLADGSKAAAVRIGRGAERCLIHAGGQEPGMHDGRNDPGFALHYSVEATPGRHTLGSWVYYEMWQLWKAVADLPRPALFYHKNAKFKADRNKARIAAANSRFMNVINGCGICLFGSFLGTKRIPTFAWLNAATGWNKTPNDYLEIGERIQTLKQMFNIKQGVDPASIRLSDLALGMPPASKGANKGRRVEIDALRRDYWTEFGWDQGTGKPTKESLTKLGIEP
jgi:aldehyde:ferredoxin oxidoreductase